MPLIRLGHIYREAFISMYIYVAMYCSYILCPTGTSRDLDNILGGDKPCQLHGILPPLKLSSLTLGEYLKDKVAHNPISTFLQNWILLGLLTQL